MGAAQGCGVGDLLAEVGRRDLGSVVMSGGAQVSTCRATKSLSWALTSADAAQDLVADKIAASKAIVDTEMAKIQRGATSAGARQAYSAFAIARAPTRRTC